MTYKTLIRQCLLEEAEQLRLSPALAEETARNVVKAVASRAGPYPDEGGGGQ